VHPTRQTTAEVALRRIRHIGEAPQLRMDLEIPLRPRSC